MYCEQCGCKLSDHAKYCKECGTMVSDVYSADIKRAGKQKGKYVKKTHTLTKLAILLLCVCLVCIIGYLGIAFLPFFAPYEKNSLPQDYDNRSNTPSTIALTPSEVTEEPVPIPSVEQEFILALEEAIKNRLSQADKDVNRVTIVNSELLRLQKYYNADFKDWRLKRMAQQYIDGIQLQKQSFDETYYDATLLWLRGMVERYEALNSIYQQYDAFTDIDGFADSYIYSLDMQKEQLSAIKSINSDLHAQLRGENTATSKQYSMSMDYTNNTNYDFSVQFYITFVDKNDKKIESTTTYFENIRTDSTYTFETYFPYDKLGNGRFNYTIQWDIWVNKFTE